VAEKATGRHGMSRWILLGLPLALFLARVALLLGHSVEFWPDELYAGTIAKALLDRVPLSLGSLSQDSHGGGVLLGLLAVPSFAALDPTLFALRLTELAFEFLTLLFLVRLLHLVYGEVTAAIGGLLYVVTAPAYALLTTQATASHTASMAWVFASLYAFARTFSGPELRRSSIFGLGLLAGLSAVFHPMAMTIWPSIVIAMIVIGRRSFLGAPSLSFVGGLVSGLAPGILVGTPKIPGLRLWGQWIWSYFPNGFVAAMQKWTSTLSTDLPRAYGFPEIGFLPDGTAGWIFHVLSWGALTWLLWAALRPGGLATEHLPVDVLPKVVHAVTLVLATYPLVILTLHSFSAFPMEPNAPAGLAVRHLAGIFPALCAVVAIVCTTSLGPPLVPLRSTAVGALLLLGVLGLRASVANDSLALPPAVEGYRYSTFREHLVEASRGDYAKLCAQAISLDPSPQHLVPLRMRLLPQRWETALVDDTPPVALAREVREMRRRFQPFGFFALGMRRGLDALDVTDLDGEEVLYVLHGIATTHVDALLEGGLLRPVLDASDALSPTEKVAFFEGIGYQLGQEIHASHVKALRALDTLSKAPPVLLRSIYRGLGIGFRGRFLGELSTIPVTVWVPPATDPRDLEAFHDGFFSRKLTPIFHFGMVQDEPAEDEEAAASP